jgi:hypothetical protein
MDRLLRLVLGTTALAGLILSLTVHVSALFGVDVASRFHGVWFLHAGIFVVFIPFVLFARHDFGAQPSLMQIGATLPRWVVVIGLIIFVYAIANFLIFMAGTEGGSPTMRDGKYLLLNHGKLIRELTASEYSAFQANVVRGFSGHWLVFFFVPAAYFLGNKSNNSFKPKPLRGSA